MLVPCHSSATLDPPTPFHPKNIIISTEFIPSLSPHTLMHQSVGGCRYKSGLLTNWKPSRDLSAMMVWKSNMPWSVIIRIRFLFHFVLCRNLFFLSFFFFFFFFLFSLGVYVRFWWCSGLWFFVLCVS